MWMIRSYLVAVLLLCSLRIEGKPAVIDNAQVFDPFSARAAIQKIQKIEKRHGVKVSVELYDRRPIQSRHLDWDDWCRMKQSELKSDELYLLLVKEQNFAVFVLPKTLRWMKPFMLQVLHVIQQHLETASYQKAYIDGLELLSQFLNNRNGIISSVRLHPNVEPYNRVIQ